MFKPHSSLSIKLLLQFHLIWFNLHLLSDLLKQTFVWHISFHLYYQWPRYHKDRYAKCVLFISNWFIAVQQIPQESAVSFLHRKGAILGCSFVSAMANLFVNSEKVVKGCLSPVLVLCQQQHSSSCAAALGTGSGWVLRMQLPVLTQSVEDRQVRKGGFVPCSSISEFN